MDLFALFGDSETERHLRSRLNDLRMSVKQILSSNLQTEFTDHSVQHSDNVARLVDRLAASLQNGPCALCEQELFVLYASCYLHDIGMQYERADSTKTIQDLKLPVRLSEMPREERGRYLRTYHNRISAELVAASRKNANPPIGFPLRDDDFPHLIASLCEGHTLDMDGEDKDLYVSLMKSAGDTIRMPLLSALLRIADILDESQRRAKRPQAEALLLPVLSQAHWYRHYYTRDIGVDPDTRKITIAFAFPSARREEYANIVPRLSVPGIQQEFRRHESVLTKCGMSWYIQPEVDSNPYSDMDEMPVEVEAEMRDMLLTRETEEVARRYRAMLGEFEQVRPLVARMMSQVADLPADGPVHDRVAKLEVVAALLGKVRASHSESLILQRVFELLGEAGESLRKLDVGLRLAPMFYDEDIYRQGLEVAEECVQIAEAIPASRTQRLDAAVLKARGLGALCAPEARDAYEDAISIAVAAHSSLAGDLVADLCEFELLSGDWDNIEATALASEASVTGLIGDAPKARIEAVVAFVRAERGQIEVATQRLQELADSHSIRASAGDERVRVLNTKAYILYLAGRLTEASEVLQVLSGEVTLRDKPELHVVLERNCVMCDLALWVSDGLKRELARDAKAIAGVSGHDALALLDALSNQEKGNHPEALTAFWRELQRASAAGDWLRFQAAAHYLAEGFLSAGNLPAAAYYAVQGLSSDLAERIGAKLLVLRDAAQIRDVIRQAMHSRLSGHFIVAAKLLEALADAIPEESVADVYSYLVANAKTELVMLASADTVRPAWKALKALCPQLPEPIAQDLLAHIQTLPLEQTNEFVLKEIVDSMNGLASRLSEGGLVEAANIVLPMVEGYRLGTVPRMHYTSALNAVCHIARRGSPGLKQTVGDRLFPPEVHTFDAARLQIIGHFKALTDKEWIAAMVERAASEVRLQVRQEPIAHGAFSLNPAPGTSMAYGEDVGGGMQRVVSLGCMGLLHAALPHVARMSPDLARLLLDACLDMAVMEDNLLRNRIALLRVIPELKPAVSPEHVAIVAERILPLAAGTGIRQNDIQRFEAANNSLNTVGFPHGDPAGLQGAALYCLSRMGIPPESELTQKVAALLRDAIVSPNDELRIWATIATQFLPTLDDSLLIAVVWGLRDPNPDIAKRSFESLVNKQTLGLDRFRTGLLLTSLRLTQDHADVAVRQAAASLARRIGNLGMPDDAELHAQLNTVIQAFETDICHSVRTAGLVAADDAAGTWS